MKVEKYLRQMGINAVVSHPEPRLAESYYKVRTKRQVKGFKDPQEVLVNDPQAAGYTVTISHPKTRKTIVLPHFTPPGSNKVPTGEDFFKFMVIAYNGGFPDIQPVSSNLLVIKVWLGEKKFEELMSCEV
jgi:hypothetical protein